MERTVIHNGEEIFPDDLDTLLNKYGGDVSKITEEEWMFLSQSDMDRYEVLNT